MIRLKDTPFNSTAAFLQNAIGIAEYYGFVPLEQVPREKYMLKRLQPISKVESEISFARRDERQLLATARRSVAGVRAGGALLAWRVTPQQGSIPAVALELHVVGPRSAIAEALLLVIGNAIIDESGIRDRVLSINNIGSPESNGRFVRDVGLYLRKHIDSITPNLRSRAATDPLGTLVQLIERGHPATPRAPQAMEYLTEDERRRFWELLEYIELSGLPYELNAHVLGSRDCWAHSLFELSMLDGESGARLPLAFGGRYDPLASRLARSHQSASVMTIICESKGTSRVPGRKRSNGVQPAIYFAHLGTEARRRALPVLETLRKASIPVHQSLWHEQIGEQMAVARTLATPYILIMGHKEAMEGTLLVREVATNSQEAIPLPDVVPYLKRRRVALGVPELNS